MLKQRFLKVKIIFLILDIFSTKADSTKILENCKISKKPLSKGNISENKNIKTEINANLDQFKKAKVLLKENFSSEPFNKNKDKEKAIIQQIKNKSSIGNAIILNSIININITNITNSNNNRNNRNLINSINQTCKISKMNSKIK